MEFNNNIPIYLQLINNIKEQLIAGKFKAGDKMPSVREYSKIVKVNPTTIQRVYKELEVEGLTYSKRGMGSFITEDKQLIIRLEKEIATQLTDEYIMKMSSLGLDQYQLQDFLKKHIKGDHND